MAKERGVRLGNPNGIAALLRASKGTEPLRAAIARNAERHAQDLTPVVEDIRAAGHTSLGAIAEELNARGMLTRRGGRWHKSTVINLLDRLGQRRAGAANPRKQREISATRTSGERVAPASWLTKTNRDPTFSTFNYLILL